MVILMIYINKVYIEDDLFVQDDLSVLHPDDAVRYSILLAFGTFYPAIYDFSQMYHTGTKDYLADKWNWIDMLYILASISQVILHSVTSPFTVASKLAMIMVLILSLGKTFFYMRIFDSMSPIVTMITKVMSDL